MGESTNLVHSLLLCGEEGSPGGGERLGGLSSTCGAGGGSVVGGPLLGGVGEERLSSGGWRTGGKTSGRGMLLRRSTTRCMAVLNSSRERAPSLDTSESCLKNIISSDEKRQRKKPTRFFLVQIQAIEIFQKTVWQCVLAKDQKCPAAMLGTDLCSILAAPQ